MGSSTFRQISECFIKPYNVSEEMKKPFHLTAFDILMLSLQYMQGVLLFTKPQNSPNFMDSFLQKLKHSLSVTLIDFYPLAARLATKRVEDPSLYHVYVDCSNFAGVRFLYATLDKKVCDITPPTYPGFVHSLFDLNKSYNHDAHTIPLMSIQVTELVDGICIACSMNHAVADGTTYWNFFNKWSDIFQRDYEGVLHALKSQPTVFDRFLLDNHDPIVNLPFRNHEEFIRKYDLPQLKERIFHFSKDSLLKLKTKANSGNNATHVSYFQSLSALMWRSITRTRTRTQDISLDAVATFVSYSDNRGKLNPPLTRGYFGNCVSTLKAVTSVGELLDRDIGWAALKLNNMVSNHDDKAIREWVENWIKSPLIYQLEQLSDPCCVRLAHSHRFNMYGNEFGLGKPIAGRSGYGNKTDGKIICYPGYDEGSIDLEVILSPDIMKVLESDEELMSFVLQPLASRI